jgi:thiamine kinase-like enzyme
LDTAPAHGGGEDAPAVRALEEAPKEVQNFSEFSSPEVIRNICAESVPGWNALPKKNLRVDQLCEGLSNQNFKVHLGDDVVRGVIPCVLFRVYGSTAGKLYNTQQELRIAEMLSSYGIGPQIYATGEAWRLEEWHFSLPLPNRKMRNPSILVQVAAQLGRLHKLHMRPDFPQDLGKKDALSTRRYRKWASGAQEAYKTCEAHPDNLPRLKTLALDEILEEGKWMLEFAHADNPKIRGAGLDTVFAHWDTQENNILQTHYGLRFIDFEYSGMEHQAFDISQYFIECTIDYLVERYPFYKVNMSDFPSDDEQRTFLSIYLSEYLEMAVRPEDVAVTVLLNRVHRFVLLNHYLWTLWSIIRASQAAPTVNAFDYLHYGEARWFMYQWSKRNLLDRGKL